MTLQHPPSEEVVGDDLPALALCWNAHCGTLAEVRKSNPARNRKAAVRFKEHSPAEWVEIITRIQKSPFCNGQNDRGWKATFDWILQPETALRVLEGKYDGSPAAARGVPGTDFDTIARRVMEAVSRISADRWARDAPDFFGPELWGVIQAAKLNIGLVRQAPPNDFTIKKLADRLRAGGSTEGR